jgi:hypothetical protein
MDSNDSLSIRSIIFIMLSGHKDSKSPRILDALVLPVIYYLCSYTICDSDSQGFGGLVFSVMCGSRKKYWGPPQWRVDILWSRFEMHSLKVFLGRRLGEWGLDREIVL